jgi:hypothetical protein
MRQQEFTDLTIERKAMHAMAGREHDHRRWTVDRISGTHLCAAGLQEIGFQWFASAVRATQDGEDTADCHIDIGIRRTVERIKQQ